MPAQRGSSSGTTSGGDIEQPSKAHLAASNQLQRLEARVAVLADDDVVVHGNAERPGHVDDGLGHLDVRARGRRIAGGMVVQQRHESSIVLK